MDGSSFLSQKSSFIPKFCVTLLAGAYFFSYASTAEEWHFIDNVNLIIHEAGHFVFALFGDFMQTLGGSLFQILFPLVYVLYFFFKRSYFQALLLSFGSAQISLTSRYTPLMQ